MSKQDFRHKFSTPVRWGDADVYGHVNNVQYMRFLESSRVAYIKDVMGMDLVAGMDVGWVLADIQCSFLYQVHYPATLDIYLRTSKIGRSSTDVIAEVYLADSDQLVLSSKAVVVWADLKLKKSAPIPTEMKSKITAFEKSVEDVMANIEK